MSERKKDIDTDRDRLLQVQMLGWLNRDPPLTEMLTVYLSSCEPSSNRGIVCALLRADRIERALSKPAWDLRHGGGHPTAVTYYEGRRETVQYLRFGSDEGVEPLVIERSFNGLREDYLEISEEFRLFHNLYHEKRSGNYFKFTHSGREDLIAVVKPNRVEIRLKEIRQFLAIKEMHLSIQFDCKEYSKYPLAELGLERGGRNQHNSLLCWSLHYEEGSLLIGHRTSSRLLGKRLFSPLPKSKSGFPGFAEVGQEKSVDFVIGLDENGDDVTESSSPTHPDYLTPVHFKKQVLDRYYLEPSKYSVEDSVLRCASLWYLQIDNHHDDRVCAWLGDLGRDLPYEEQLHWRVHNIPPQGGISRTYLRRQLQAQFADSERPEHLFSERYAELAAACEEHLGWQLLLPLEADDQHHLRCVRVPSTDEQREFDELVLGLTKILVDSLNEKHLARLLPPEQDKKLKGSIARLEAACEACGVQDAIEHVSFLRSLQSLRSSSAAHRKGSNYRKAAAKIGAEDLSLREIFSLILNKSLQTLEFFILVVQNGQFNERSRANPSP